MPRPSLKQQRSQEILDAFVRCVARFGLEGATQERIAEEAGVRRTLLRHYLGNRDQMIAALVDHVVAKYDALTEGLQSTLAASESGEMLLDILFTPSSHADQQLTLVFQALVTTSSEYPATQKPLLGSITRFIRLLEKQLQRAYPQQSKRELQAVAHGLVGIYLTHDALTPLAPPVNWRQSSRRAADILLAHLKD